jgi:serine/threonine protein kinase
MFSSYGLLQQKKITDKDIKKKIGEQKVLNKPVQKEKTLGLKEVKVSPYLQQQPVPRLAAIPRQLHGLPYKGIQLGTPAVITAHNKVTQAKVTSTRIIQQAVSAKIPAVKPAGNKVVTDKMKKPKPAQAKAIWPEMITAKAPFVDVTRGKKMESKVAETKMSSPRVATVSPEFNMRDLNISYDHVLGTGGFGTVYKATWQGKAVAVKVPNLVSDIVKTKEIQEEFVDEIKKVKKIMHVKMPNVVGFYGVSLLKQNYRIVMQYMAYGSLHHVIHHHADLLTFSRQLQIIRDMVNGLDALHQRGLVHRDMKSPNVLLNGDMRAYVGDLAATREINSVTKIYRSSSLGVVGTPGWIAPESYLSRTYSANSDYFALGVIIWEMVSRQNPQLIDMDKPGKAQKFLVAEGKREAIPAACPPLLSGLMQRCWQTRPWDRPDKQQILDYLNPDLTEQSEQFSLPIFAQALRATTSALDLELDRMISLLLRLPALLNTIFHDRDYAGMSPVFLLAETSRGRSLLFAHKQLRAAIDPEVLNAVVPEGRFKGKSAADFIMIEPFAELFRKEDPLFYDKIAFEKRLQYEDNKNEDDEKKSFAGCKR